ncbi:Protease HtpX [Trichinella pseudospiralis]
MSVLFIFVCYMCTVASGEIFSILIKAQFHYYGKWFRLLFTLRSFISSIGGTTIGLEVSSVEIVVLSLL